MARAHADQKIMTGRGIGHGQGWQRHGVAMVVMSAQVALIGSVETSSRQPAAFAVQIGRAGSGVAGAVSDFRYH